MGNIKVIPKYTIEDVCIMLDMAEITISRLRKRDETFPKPLTERPLKWVAAHIDAWIDHHSKLPTA